MTSCDRVLPRRAALDAVAAVEYHAALTVAPVPARTPTDVSPHHGNPPLTESPVDNMTSLGTHTANDASPLGTGATLGRIRSRGLIKGEWLVFHSAGLGKSPS